MGFVQLENKYFLSSTVVFESSSVLSDLERKFLWYPGLLLMRQSIAPKHQKGVIRQRNSPVICARSYES